MTALYHQYEAENFESTLTKISTPFQKLSIWSGLRIAKFIIIIPQYVVGTVTVSIVIVPTRVRNY
jgi:hypothetical protein